MRALSMRAGQTCTLSHCLVPLTPAIRHTRNLPQLTALAPAPVSIILPVAEQGVRSAPGRPVCAVAACGSAFRTTLGLGFAGNVWPLLPGRMPRQPGLWPCGGRPAGGHGEFADLQAPGCAESGACAIPTVCVA
jgi:hypothetical protein